MQPLTKAAIEDFQTVVWAYYRAHRRSMPWRDLHDQHNQQLGSVHETSEYDPYTIFVSELMLQQTQVPRVIPKFQQFMVTFPTVESLATASLADVLTLWSGLGYNRRAKFLWQAAQKVVGEFNGQFPRTVKDLQKLPGVGVNTAGAIMAYAYNQPVVFIETNVRTVFIYHFGGDAQAVTDAELREYVAATLPQTDVRNWYYALMDYGSYLKGQAGNVARKSAHYTKQSPLEGSRRQIRGKILKYLTEGAHTLAQLHHAIADERLPAVLVDLQQEQLIHHRSGLYRIGPLA